ncbi:MAG: S1 RNA-binding domain-containing protein [Anaerolineae bacterium]|nr:S1 RNA-binding domain-containing protein [Anaerolineae bacterium]
MSAPMTLDDLRPGIELKGTVKRIELYGAFVDIGVGTDALLHISQLGKANVRNVEDIVKVGEETTVYVMKVDKDTKRIALSLVKPSAINWDTLKEGDILEGEVERIENFGAFINIGAERPGMVHVSEMAEGFVKSPSDVVKVGEKVQVRILKINRKKRQIDLSMKQPEEKIEIPQDEEEDDLPTAMALALRKAMSSDEEDEEETFVTPRKRQRGR